METIPVSLRLPEVLYVRLRRLARKEAVLRDCDMSMADLVRETLCEQFPEDDVNEVK